MVRQTRIYQVSTANNNEKNKIDVDKPASFEEAITACGFGKFNYLFMLFACLPCNWASVISMTNVPQIIPTLKCDFQMSLSEIGILNASPFIGNLLSPFIWGYVADTVGRKKLLIITALLDTVCIVSSALSQNLIMIIILKIVSGFLIAAPAGTVMSYLSECHNNHYRNKMVLTSGVLMSTCHVLLPSLAWSILPHEFQYIRSWQLYLLVCAIPSAWAGISFIFMPETPKFLMNAGQHDEALQVFQLIYSINTGKPKNTFPITKLLCTTKADEIKKKEKLSVVFRKSLQQFKPLLHKPYPYRLVLATTAQLFLLLSVNTLRMWLPELLTLLEKSEQKGTVCEIVLESLNKSKTDQDINENINGTSCLQLQNNDDVYIKLIIIGFISLIMYICVSLITFVINKRIILGLVLLISGLSGISLIWTADPIIILLVAALYTAQTGVALFTFISIIIEIFPTSFRTLTLLIAMTTGRIGSICGNIVFPILLELECMSSFIFLSTSVTVCIIPLVLMTSIKPEEM